MIEQAILKINSNAQFTVYGTDIDTCIINWNDGTNEISKADIKKEIAELQTAYDAKEYQRDRATEYPSIQEQLDMQYWDNVNGTTNWEDAIAKVKADNPKG